MFEVFRCLLAGGYYTDRKRKIRKDVAPHIEKLKKFSDRELCEIYTNLNTHKWDMRLGAEPEWNRGVYGNDYRKEMYSVRRICFILRAIENIVGEKDISRYWNVEYLGKSEKEFEEFWRKYGEDA